MSNSMRINLKVDNTISNLSFLWKAIFKDGIIINQLDGGKDINYKKVKDNFDNLAYFYLSDNKNNIFMVNLLKGIIIYNNFNNFEINESKEKKNIRLIYFRRVCIDSTTNGKMLSQKIFHFLGFQYNLENNENRKVILIIDENGNWIIGE